MSNWCVVRTKTGAEDRAVWHLQNQGFVTYLPRYRKQVRHARKTKTVLRPLFPGYLFVNMDMGQRRWRSINGTVGVISLIQFGQTPGLVPEDMIKTIRLREDESGAVNLAPDGLKKGDTVNVREGAFAEYTAILEEVWDEKRVVLLLDLMGRTVRVTTPMANLAKAS